MPYFEYMKREFYVNADPGISLTQFFLRNQPAELRTTFYSMYEGNLEDITEEEIESFCMKFERKANKTEINKLMDILDLKRGISESPMGYLARLKLMVVRISNIHDMLPEDAFILAKLLNEIPKPICADLADEYQLNPTIVCEMWETYLKRMTINNHFLKQSNPGYNVNGTTRGNGGMNRVTNSRFTSNNTTRYNAVDSYNDKRNGIDGRAFNNHDDKLYRGNQNQRRDDYVTNIVNMYNERKHDSMNDTKKNDERYPRSAEVFQPNAREPVVNNQENRQGGKTIFCYVCGDPNHYASRCPNRKQEQIVSKIINQKILKIPNTYQQSPTIRTVLMIS
uniref:CCHC-type domain-containing protein n=1 Tax=Strongyloides papillosus TaxID=174720 RepID=A0A0N5BF07_STREA